VRLIVFSDSHGRLDYALRVLKEAGKPDLILHAGDNYRDGLRLAEITGLPVKAVPGNCDQGEQEPLELLLELAGYRILMTHGHKVPYEQMHERLLARAAETGADAVVFGHTHTAEIRKDAGVLFFNPGSIAKPRDQQRPSYGILDLGKDGIKPLICRVL
jgi:putative phosphoesterase